jgi:hypothetical protein
LGFFLFDYCLQFDSLTHLLVFLCFVPSDEIIRFRQIKPQMGERLDAEWIPDETPIFKKLGGTAGLELEKPEEQESQEEQKDDIEKEEEDNKTAKLQVVKSEEEREGADQEKADDDSDQAAGKQEAAEQDRDMMDGDDVDVDSPQEEDPAESNKSSQVSSMLAKILNLGSQSAGQVVLKVGEGSKLFSILSAHCRCFGCIILHV